jgi:hypothetical protein
VPQVELAPEPIIEAPVVVQPSGDCASELAKYDWPQNDAYKIMFKESSNNPATLNNNPGTGDYSIGCFQVNIKGSLALNRPSEAELKDPVVNVRWAYNHYVAEGRTFCHTSGWYNSCRATGVN